jgi:hypothetical protein
MTAPHHPGRPSYRRQRAMAAVYAALALAVGLFVSAIYALPCEGRGFCSDLDRSGGYVLLIALPPTVVLSAAFVASAWRRPWILHATFFATVVLVPAVTVGLGSLTEG